MTLGVPSHHAPLSSPARTLGEQAARFAHRPITRTPVRPATPTATVTTLTPLQLQLKTASIPRACPTIRSARETPIGADATPRRRPGFRAQSRAKQPHLRTADKAHKMKAHRSNLHHRPEIENGSH